MHFIVNQTRSWSADKRQANGLPGRAYFIVRPNEDFTQPVHQILRPDGQVVLLIVEAAM